MTRLTLIIPALVALLVSAWPEVAKAETVYIGCPYKDMPWVRSNGLEIKLVETFFGGTKVYYLPPFKDEYRLVNSKVNAETIEFWHPIEFLKLKDEYMPKDYKEPEGTRRYIIKRITGEIWIRETFNFKRERSPTQYGRCKTVEPKF